MLRIEEHGNREEWLAARDGHIGASEAASVIGIGFMTTRELWEIKTGQKKAPDLSDRELVAYGNRAEGPLRDLFMAKHPELELEYRPYDFLYQEDRPWLRATLDGILTDGDRTGILEIKTATPNSKAEWDEWRDQIPLKYNAQISHQFLATGFDFAVVFAELHGRSEYVLREYWYEREDMTDNMDYLLGKEEAFWGSVQHRKIPPMPLRL